MTMATPAAAQSRPEVMLEGFARLEPDSARGGPPAGQFNDQGVRLPQPRFASQPVQGISGIAATSAATTWLALSDNGFGTQWNSPD
jgi:hypothetical protein